jgi:glutamate formiminotransferase
VLGERLRAGELEPDFGPAALHPSAGATLVTARPPLAAFNVELDTGDVEVARTVAASLRESGGGLPGVRALGIGLGERAQVSTNVHDPVAVPLGAVIERVRELAAAHGARPLAGEVVGLVPAAALRLLPADVPLRGFDPARQVIERRLGHDR